MRAAAVLGIDLHVAGPSHNDYRIEKEVIEECSNINKQTGGKLTVSTVASEAVKQVDVVITDSWMSYGKLQSAREERVKQLSPFRVTKELMSQANNNAIFLHCLPALRGDEVVSDVIDGPQSVVFDQAENRLHAQKALLLFLLKSEAESQHF